MEKRKFLGLSAAAIACSLIYVPVDSCNAHICIRSGHEFIFDLYAGDIVNTGNLLIQVGVITLLAVACYFLFVDKSQ
jgi:hypothetical protein